MELEIELEFYFFFFLHSCIPASRALAGRLFGYSGA